MPATFAQDTDGLLTMTVSGQLRKADLDAAQACAAAAIARHGKVRTLVLAEGFQGWESGQDWGDLGFMMAHDHEIEKIAVVGPVSWRDEVLMFLGAGIRAATVRYFGLDELELARFWAGASDSAR